MAFEFKAPEMTTDEDRWGYVAGATFAQPEEWVKVAASFNPLYGEPIAQALAAAADQEGQIINFRVNEWYEGHLSDAMRDEFDAPEWTLGYDRFAAAVLLDVLSRVLVFDGWLATRGNGDSYDYRLTLPPPA